MSAADETLGTIRTRIPARLDRLPWSRFHWRVVFGLGTVWILDGLEVTIVGFLGAAPRRQGQRDRPDERRHRAGGVDLRRRRLPGRAVLRPAHRPLRPQAPVPADAAPLHRRHRRDRLRVRALVLLRRRFFTGAGIGGEYAAINSAIDELIPARARGRVDLIINGTYWLGAAGGALPSLIFLDQAIFAADVGWRLAFGMGAVLGLAILFVRRHVPESPRWLFIHGREEEAERDRRQHRVARSRRRPARSSRSPRRPDRRSTSASGSRSARSRGRAFRVYPKRAILGLALFVGQAFLYNAVTFDLGDAPARLLRRRLEPRAVLYSSSSPPATSSARCSSGRLFDTVGRQADDRRDLPRLGACCWSSLAILFRNGSSRDWTLHGARASTFFFASAGASSAYLTVSEIFPMETRALAIAFFYAVGTAVGGIAGPLVFGQLIHDRRRRARSRSASSSARS